MAELHAPGIGLWCVPRNRVDPRGPIYENLDAYLETLFRLMRADAMGPLRAFVEKLRGQTYVRCSC